MAEAPYCLRCGRHAVYLVASMDASHPLVMCAYRDARDQPRGCGRQLGGYDEAEAVAVAALLREAAVNHKHERHVLERRVDAKCPSCRKANPEKYARVHPYERISDKHRLAHHLSQAHSMGDGSSLVVHEPVTKLYSEHERLHRERPGGFL